MDIRNNVDGLKTLLGVSTLEAQKPGSAKGTPSSSAPELTGDSATLSSGATAASQAVSASNAEVRMAKVTAVQSALAAGTYNVPASAVAGKVLEAMLANGDGCR
ncbi:MAG TPA: flagellar biosynthesis anti-sigma factor FlgM [Terracidiphilus sp.]|nr:flagellar biosynthesis anti-sigma factor FlgM [Terracidiphilus sp.]